MGAIVSLSDRFNRRPGEYELPYESLDSRHVVVSVIDCGPLASGRVLAAKRRLHFAGLSLGLSNRGLAGQETLRLSLNCQQGRFHQRMERLLVCLASSHPCLAQQGNAKT